MTEPDSAHVHHAIDYIFEDPSGNELAVWSET